MKRAARVMEHTLAYRIWQAPFAERKLAPLLGRGDLRAARRVLDVGCGPGTNTRHFAHADYLGIDHNPDYIADAARRHGRRFLVADVTAYTAPPDERFDFIFMNSLLHHIATPDARRLLGHLRTLLTEDGHIHILDLILPARPSLARALARADRGDFPRPLGAWRELLEEHFEPVIVEPYPLGAAGLTMWEMLYFKGRARC